MKTCSITIIQKEDVMVEKEKYEKLKKQGDLNGFRRPVGICREFRGDFLKLEHCPDAVQLVASAALITIPLIPTPTPSIHCHLFSFNDATICEQDPGSHVQQHG